MAIIMYECDSSVKNCPGDNILTPDGFKLIKEVEDYIKNLPDYPKFCLATSVNDKTCSPQGFTSPLAIFESAITSAGGIDNIS